MGIRFTCPNGHKLHVKSFLAGKRGVCPQCGAKIQIPAADESEPAEPASAATPGQNGPAFVLPPAGMPAATEIGSQSIIIAMAEPIAVSAPPPPAASPIAADSTISAVGPPVVAPVAAPSSIGAPQPMLITDAVEPVSPAVTYVARRERSRRNQITIAVVLLVTVIVLAGVLIWVLQRDAAQPPADNKPAPANSNR